MEISCSCNGQPIETSVIYGGSIDVSWDGDADLIIERPSSYQTDVVVEADDGTDLSQKMVR
jgi:hypothetical protein